MESELLVLALGHPPVFRQADPIAPSQLEKSVDEVISHLPEADRGRVYSVKALCKRYGNILTWSRRQRSITCVRISPFLFRAQASSHPPDSGINCVQPKQLQVLASCCEEILLRQISSASMLGELQDVFECVRCGFQFRSCLLLYP
jgi:hypothetical protein